MLPYISETTIEKIGYQTDSKLAIGEYENCTFKQCDLGNVDLSGFKFLECRFISCNLSNVRMDETVISNCEFVDCKLMGTRFDRCQSMLLSFRFTGCLLDQCSFYQLNLKSMFFKDCSLTGADFTESNLSSCKFDNCNFLNAQFDQTNLEKADLSTSYNIVLDPVNNRIGKARYSIHGLAGLLTKYQIEIIQMKTSVKFKGWFCLIFAFISPIDTYAQNENISFELGGFHQYSNAQIYRNFPDAYGNVMFGIKESLFSIGFESSMVYGEKERIFYDQIIVREKGAILTKPDTFRNVVYKSAHSAITYHLNIRMRLLQSEKRLFFFNVKIGMANLKYATTYTNFYKTKETYTDQYLSLGMGLGFGLPIDPYQKVHVIAQVSKMIIYSETHATDIYLPPYNDYNIKNFHAKLGIKLTL